MSNSTVALAREQIVFAVEETTAGTLVFPTTSNAGLICAGYPTLRQSLNREDSEEVRNSLDIINRFVGKRSPVDVTIPFYLRPSGSLGSVPMGDILYESLMGLKTTTPATSVVYSQDMSKKTFSLWVKQGHLVQFAKGVAAEGLTTTLQNTGAVMQEFTGRGMDMGWGGSATLATGITVSNAGAVVLGSGEGYRFSVGARIYNKTKDYNNSNAGWAVTAVSNAGLQVATINATGANWEVGDEVAAFLPDFGNFIGSPVENRYATVSLDGGSTTAKATGFTLNIGSPVQFLDDEIDTNQYPTEYVENVRDIGGTLTLHMRKADAERLYAAREGTSTDVRVVLGTTSGSKLQIDMDYCDLDFPEVSVNAPVVDISIPFKALGSSGEDSCTLTFI